MALTIANTWSSSLSFIRLAELVEMIDVISPATVRMTISETTLPELVLSILPDTRFVKLRLVYDQDATSRYFSYAYVDKPGAARTRKQPELWKTSASEWVEANATALRFGVRSRRIPSFASASVQISVAHGLQVLRVMSCGEFDCSPQTFTCHPGNQREGGDQKENQWPHRRLAVIVFGGWTHGSM